MIEPELDSTLSQKQMPQTSKKIGQILIDQGLITAAELNKALELQIKSGGRLGELLIKMGLVSEADLLSTLSIQYKVPVVDLKNKDVQTSALTIITEEVARKSTIFPLGVMDDSLIVAMAYPDDVQTIRDISTRSGKKIEFMLATPSEINNAIDLYYRASKEIEHRLQQISSSEEIKENPTSEMTAETPVAQTLYLILQQAVRDRASDVHIEPQENRVRVRFRIDGLLHDMYSLPPKIHSALISRIKILAEMNIAEQRRSQDGQFSLQVGLKEIDLRAATMATIYGERVALRILDKTLTPLSLEEIGFSPDQLNRYRRALSSTFGIILVGGPTGSGKTTTLYASLNQFDSNIQNIITIEDPVEYKFKNINQTQINPKAGITFAGGLRTILRHDPDVVLVGEIRDKDTANIATQAALTGRLVLATIHANDAISILFRLIDLGIEPYLISPTLVAAVAQRMVRRICPYCKEEAEILPVEAEAYYKELGEKPVNMYKGKGCTMCAGTGYRGRISLIEILSMSEGLRRMVLSSSSSEEIKSTALKEGMITVQRDGMLKAKQGITTISEVLRSTSTG